MFKKWEEILNMLKRDMKAINNIKGTSRDENCIVYHENGINGRLNTTEGSDLKSLQKKLFKMKQ